MNKKAGLIAAFVVLCASTAFIQFKSTTPAKIAVQSNRLLITQSIEGKQKKELVNKGSTALNVLLATHKVTTVGKNENAFVTAIDGRGADTQKKEFWAFYVNGKQAEVGAGTYIVKNNDTIEWKVETY